ncbi:LicD family protein [Marinilabiliaceae bacterium JC017]|nr:LicD family protein [Marinilabiliaceae bacterium JC017]
MRMEGSLDTRHLGINTLDSAQKVMLKLLKDFDRLCRKHQLKYWLDSGTILGAVRHSGFIPWDDDLDVCMPREDYEKFKKIANDYLPEDVFLQTRELDKGTKWRFLKLRDKYSTYIQKSELNRKIKYHQGIFIDIFPYDIVDTNTYSAKIFLNRNFKRSSIPLVKKFYGLFNFLMLAPLKLIPYSVWKNYFLKKYSKEKGKYAATGLEIMIFHQLIPTSYIFPLKKIKFEDEFFSAPNDCHSYLKHLYGNYMELPPIENRKIHAHKIFPFTKCNHPDTLDYQHHN